MPSAQPEDMRRCRGIGKGMTHGGGCAQHDAGRPAHRILHAAGPPSPGDRRRDAAGGGRGGRNAAPRPASRRPVGTSALWSSLPDLTQARAYRLITFLLGRGVASHAWGDLKADYSCLRIYNSGNICRSFARPGTCWNIQGRALATIVNLTYSYPGRPKSNFR